MTAGRKVNTSSKSWNTSPDIVSLVHTSLGGGIELDPCSNDYSMVNANTSFFIEDDGLIQDWSSFSTIFVNPPYGRGIYDWVKKCANCIPSQSVVALIPVAVNTKHWKDWIYPHANAIAFLKDTRPKFWLEGFPIAKGAPMACCLVHWGSGSKIFCETVGERCEIVIPYKSQEYTTFR